MITGILTTLSAWARGSRAPGGFPLRGLPHLANASLQLGHVLDLGVQQRGGIDITGLVVTEYFPKNPRRCIPGHKKSGEDRQQHYPR